MISNENTKFEPELFSTLEFDRIVELTQDLCIGQNARSRLDNLPVYTDLAPLEIAIEEVYECLLAIENGQTPPLREYEDLSEDLFFLEKANYVLNLDGIVRIRNILQIFSQIYTFFSALEADDYPTLKQQVLPLEFDSSWLEYAESILDERGEVRPNASPELIRIDKEIRRKEREIDKSFQAYIRTFAAKKMLGDSPESIRNGRRVLTVPAEHKRQIKGIIHDESATGKTVFLEPEEIVVMNNALFELQNEKRREIHKLIASICELWRPYTTNISDCHDAIIAMDIIRAKAKFAFKINAKKPQIQIEPHFEIINGRHPLLLLSLNQKNKQTIAFDFTLHPPNQIVLISGPNAGGKTVLMKAIGLMQLMLQAGFLVPCDDNSRFGLVESIYVDIGDQQSIEDDLSTYSSRLKNMNHLLRQANNKSLILIDEFGSGTDPKQGGAIAESLLKELNSLSCWAVITTHYSNLKAFAYNTKGIVNASMLFDQKALKPTYELKIGRPGSSFAFEIASQSGLSNKLLEYAKKRTGSKEYSTEALLNELQDQKRRLDQQLDKLDRKESQLEKLIKNYEQLHSQLELQRKKHKLLIKERNLQLKSEASKTLDRLIKDIRENQKLASAKHLSQKLKEQRAELVQDVQTIKQELFYKDSDRVQALKQGDFVRLRTGQMTGKILRIQKKRAEIIMGQVRMEVNLSELVPANEPLERNTGRSIQTQLTNPHGMKESELDIRGYRTEDAAEALDQFIDKAIVANLSLLRIVHGKGNGVLRKFVTGKLKEYSIVQSYCHPENDQGGDGVTIVQL